MSDCVLEDLIISFEVSGFKLNPLSVDLRQSLSKDSFCRVRITRQAAEALSEDYLPREPVVLRYKGRPVYRGYIKQAGLSIGQNDGKFEITDPLKILEKGSVNMEKLGTTLDEIVSEVFPLVRDEYGVINGYNYTSEVDIDEYQYQHPKSTAREIIGDAEFLVSVQDALREGLEEIGLMGPGNFDYRDDTPRHAMQNIASSFGINMFVDADGTLFFGYQDAMPNAYTTGVSRGQNVPWKMTDYYLPDHGQPYGRVVVSGKSYINDDIVSDVIDIATSPLYQPAGEVTPRASASFGGYSGDTYTVDYTSTTDLNTLENVAANVLIQQFYDQTKGSITVDCIAEGDPYSVEKLKPGDQLIVEGAPECGVQSNVYRITDLIHTIDSGGTWDISFNVTKTFPAKIMTNSWLYDVSDATVVNESQSYLDRSVNSLRELSVSTGIMEDQSAVLYGAYKWAQYNTNFGNNGNDEDDDE